MLKKAALVALAFAVPLMAPLNAAAQVHVGVSIGAPAVVVQPAPVVVYGEPYIALHYWDSGFHGGYYYEPGARYRIVRGHRFYDDRYRDERISYDRGHRDHGHHYGEYREHERHGHGHEDHGRGHDRD